MFYLIVSSFCNAGTVRAFKENEKTFFSAFGQANFSFFLRNFRKKISGPNCSIAGMTLETAEFAAEIPQARRMACARISAFAARFEADFEAGRGTCRLAQLPAFLSCEVSQSQVG
ncbi:MAG: hypothetical protein DBX55_00335 [Verrucomicrobia bacterium]|nr:MAG: hypothetical protein DBX55_00335 [Verrucomicrobiota bacterium]